MSIRKNIRMEGMDMGLPNPTISFRIPVELLKRLEKEAKDNDVTKTSILIESLMQYLDKNKEE